MDATGCSGVSHMRPDLLQTVYDNKEQHADMHRDRGAGLTKLQPQPAPLFARLFAHSAVYTLCTASTVHCLQFCFLPVLLSAHLFVLPTTE
eukprot:1144920-Pelagomonas_calceolata.AAC.2